MLIELYDGSDAATYILYKYIIHIPNPLNLTNIIIRPCHIGKPSNLKSKSRRDLNDDMCKVDFNCNINDENLCEKAKNSLYDACQNISSLLILKEQIVINATFLADNSYYLGATAPARLYLLKSEDGVIRAYPQALAKQFELTLNDTLPYDIEMVFNPYEPISALQYNFFIISLHEIFHGLGFFSLFGNSFATDVGLSSESISPYPEFTGNVFEGFVETIFDKFVYILADSSEPENIDINSFTNITAEFNKIGPPPKTYSSESEFLEELTESPQWKNIPPYLYRKFTLQDSTIFIPLNEDVSNGTYLETGIAYNQGSTISHVSSNKYRDTSDFLMVYNTEAGISTESLINKFGVLISPRLIAIMYSIGGEPEPEDPGSPPSSTNTIIHNSSSTKICLDTWRLWKFALMILIQL
ncbi:11050_t:CDS:2 [Diversispora eburnea]|uniref:11050_t:CDS:1 n=1 Tax=Diversispora eburnea TaxID=1213867 RepID=A0A9N8ZJV0_9GLOM|nr:11050_t:CDS:2 [Diversispora eburnea]